MYLVLSVGKVPVLVYFQFSDILFWRGSQNRHVMSHVSVCAPQYLSISQFSHLSLLPFSNVVTPASGAYSCTLEV